MPLTPRHGPPAALPDNLQKACTAQDWEPWAGLAAQLALAPMALVACLDSQQQWQHAAVGLAPPETVQALAWREHLLHQAGTPWVVADTLQEPLLCNHPLVLGPPHIRFFAGMALVDAEKGPMGILAVMDTQARPLTPQQLQSLHLLAHQALAPLQQVQEHTDLERCRRVASAMTDAVWDWNLRTDELWWGQRNQDLLGAPGQTLVPDNAAWALRLHPQDSARVLQGRREALDGTLNTWCAQYRFRCHNERYKWVLERAVVVRDASGKAVRMTAGMIDCSAQKKAEFQLRHQARIHADLVQVQQKMSCVDIGLPEVLAMVAEAAVRASGANAAMVELREGENAVAHACAGPLACAQADCFPLPDHLTWPTLKKGLMVLCHDTQAHQAPVQGIDGCPNVRSILAVPLHANHTVVGTLKVISDEPHAFSHHHVANLQILLESLGSLVQLRRISAQLQASEQQFRLLFKAHPQPMWVYLQEGNQRIVAVNQAMEYTYGYSEAELLQMDVHALWPPQDKDSLQAARPGQCLSTIPKRHQRKDGTLLDVEVTAQCIPFNGQTACQVMVVDVTERRRVERDLERVGRARHLLSTCNETLMRATSEPALLQAICRIVVDIGGYCMAWVGWACDDAEKTIQPVAHVGNNDNYLETLQLSWSDAQPNGLGSVGSAVRSGQASIVQDLQASPHYEGAPERIQAHGFQGAISLPLRHDNHTFGVLCLYACEELHPTPEETQLLQELANDLAFGIMGLRTRKEQQCLQSSVLKVAAAVSATTGTEFFVQLASNMADALGAQVGCVGRLVAQPDGQTPHINTLALVVNGQLQGNAQYPLTGTPGVALLQQGQHFIQEGLQGQYPHAPIANQVGAQSYAGQQLCNSQGMPLGVIFVLFAKPLKNVEFVMSTMQIFAARAAAELERQITDSHIQRQASLLDKAQDAILVRDLQHRILFWNKGAERMYGWTQAQALQQSAITLLYEDSASFHHAYQILMEQGEWTGELVQKHRNGHLLDVEVRWTLVRNEDSEPESVLSINTDISKRKETERQVQRLAFYDALTGLPNRMLLMDRMHHALATSQRSQQGGALLFIDMDNFKTLNDTLGHDMGDLLLQQVAQRLNSCVRSVDTVARLGGDEFVVVLEGLSADPDELTLAARTLGEKILTSLAVPYNLAGYQYRSTPSIGIALFVGDGHNVGDLLRHADMAMYQSKAAGRNTLRFYDPQMQAVVLARAELEAALRSALAQNQFLLHYQPQVNHLGQFMGVEALVRWQHPERGLVFPADFIALAEETGLILTLGRWVLHNACSLLARWRNNPVLRELTMAVNVSSRQFRHASFITDVARILAITGAPA
ncbi:MAG: diguanylate cyclase, partial [Simplicispira sp.]|nr:diguanylate cyclase [Simplicispira sp.]